MTYLQQYCVYVKGRYLYEYHVTRRELREMEAGIEDGFYLIFGAIVLKIECIDRHKKRIECVPSQAGN